MEAGSEGRLRSTLGVFGTAFRNRSLLLVELAWLAFNSAEWGVWVHAHGRVRLQPAAARRRLGTDRRRPAGASQASSLAPFLGAHHRPGGAPGRVLFGRLPAHHGRSAWRAPARAPSALARPRPVVIYVPRPARVPGASPSRARRRRRCCPWVVRSPLELTAANVVSGWVGERQRCCIAPGRSPGCCSRVGGPALSAGAVLAALHASAAPLPCCLCSGSADSGRRCASDGERASRWSAEVRSRADRRVARAAVRTARRACVGRAVRPRRRARRAVRRCSRSARWAWASRAPAT